MKFIHVADVHLDSKTVGIKQFYGQSSLCISELVQKAFVSLIDLAIDEKVDFVIIAGDLFDSNWKDYAIGLFFIDQIKRLSCPVYYIRGNHDSENRLMKSLPYPQNLYLFESNQPQTIIHESLKIALHGQSYSHYHIQDDLVESYPPALSGYFNIGILHSSGSKKNGEPPYAPYDELILKSKGYHYWALGHIHQNQIVSTNPLSIYSGVIQGRHIKETGPKGCYLITVDEREIKNVDFCSLATAVWLKIELELSEITNIQNLKLMFLHRLESLLNETKEPILILRLIFIGHNNLERSFSAYLDEWVHTFYCWITEGFTRKIYLERIVDFTKQKNTTRAFNPLAASILDRINIKEKNQDIVDLFEKERNVFNKKIPQEALGLESFEENQNEIPNELKVYLERLFDEVNQ